MTWLDVEPALQRRLKAWEPAALKEFFARVAAKYRCALHWTAKPEEWRQVGADVYGPPPIDPAAALIVGHELAHRIAGPCPRTGDHRANLRGRTLSCLACENRAHELAWEMLPFHRDIHQRSRAALMTYRRTPAPLAAQGEADRLAGNLAYAEQSTRAVKWQDKLDRQERATADAARDLEREAAKRRRFDEMVERTKRAKERWS